MSGWLEEWGEDVPEATPHHGEMDHGSNGMMTTDQMAALEDTSGDEFDQQFLELMIEHHEGAIAMAEVELSEGANEDAKELAQEIMNAQQAEIDHMRELLEQS